MLRRTKNDHFVFSSLRVRQGLYIFSQCQEIEKAAFSLDLSSTPFIIFFVDTAFDQVSGTCPSERVGQKRCAEYCCY